MKIYQWRHSYKGNSHILNYKWRERQTNSSIFNKGKNLPFDCGYVDRLNTLQDPSDYDLIYHAEINEEKLKGYACMPNNGQAPLVNQKALDILLDLCSDKFQYFPVTIVGENPKHPPFENHDYFLINITQTVDGIDKERTEMEYLPQALGGNICGVESNFTLNSPLNQFSLARDSTLKSYIYVAEPLVKAFKKAKINGVKFELLGETTFVE